MREPTAAELSRLIDGIIANLEADVDFRWEVIANGYEGVNSWPIEHFWQVWLDTLGELPEDVEESHA